MAQKPQEIIELEKIYGITLTETKTVNYLTPNCYELNKNGDVIAINFTGNKKNLITNKIKEIRGFEIFTNIEKLILSNNQISKIENLENLTNLQELDLTFNEINKIENLDKLSNLQRLYLFDNKINKIENFENLTNLEILDLSGNQIRTIENLEQLTNLKRLALIDNQIENIENLEKLTYLPNLNYLRINSNPFEKELVDLKLEEFENNLETLRNYFKLKNAKEKIEKKLTKKVMLIGNHGSGKSTFLHYFFENNLDKSSKSTHILKIEKYPKSGDTKAMFYDFGGQDYYHGIYKAFMTNEALNLIFWKNVANNNKLGNDENEGETQNFNREYWIKQVKHFGNKNKSWLIQNRFGSDKREPLLDDKLQNEIEDEYNVILDGDIKPNLIALKANLQTFIDEPRKIKISKSYEEFITNEILNHNSYEAVTVTEVEKKFENTEKIDFKTQLSQLSLQGMVLYYKDVPELENVIWLNPQAIVKHIHDEIFEKTQMKKYAGIVPQKEFEEICKDKRIRLMLEKNKVIYFDKVEHNYIIPSYLKRADKDGDEFFYFTSFNEPSLVLKFEYFIPFGFINQLICHYGDIKEKKTYWRDMLLFTINEKKTQILIKLDFEKLQIEIYVSNKDNKNKQKETIKYLFDDICALYEDIFGYKSKLLPKNENPIEPIDNKHISQKVYEITYPEDMYISFDNKHFVNFNILNDEQKTKESVLAYEIEEFKINKNKAKSLFTRNFAYLATNNKGLNKMKKIFVSYSRKDADYRDELRNHLSILSTFDIADNWACEDITIGKWDEQIQKELLDSDIVIYMLSANFFSSSYIRENEVLEVMKQMKENPNKKILPIIVSEFVGLDSLERKISEPTPVQEAMLDIKNYQFLPYGNFWNHLKNQNEEKIMSLVKHRNNGTLDEALKQICERIVEVI